MMFRSGGLKGVLWAGVCFCEKTRALKEPTAVPTPSVGSFSSSGVPVIRRVKYFTKTTTLRSRLHKRSAGPFIPSTGSFSLEDLCAYPPPADPKLHGVNKLQPEAFLAACPQASFTPCRSFLLDKKTAGIVGQFAAGSILC